MINLIPLEDKQRIKYNKYMRRYYKNKTKLRVIENREKTLKTHLFCQLVEEIAYNPMDFKTRKIRNKRKQNPKIYKFLFYSRVKDKIPVEDCYTNEDIAKWVAQNYGEGRWSFRTASFTTYGFYHVRYRELLKIEIKEEQSDFTFRFLKIRTTRLNKYWFRKPEFQRNLKRQQL